MFKLVPDDPVSEPVTGTPGNIDRHIGDFREFFQSRGVSFGSATDLPPFVARLGADARFRDEMASMVRTVIYRERDGLSRLELVEMIAVAVEGTQAENARRPEVLDAERQIVAFVDGVFRTRWNPGAASKSPAAEQGESAAANEAALEPLPVVAPVEGVKREAAGEDVGRGEAAPALKPHATTDLFYRAQVVAGVEPAAAIAQERKVESGNGESGAQPSVEPVRESPGPVEPVHESLSAEQYEVLPLQTYAEEATESGKKTSRFWMWTAGVCALIFAFCAGLFVHQRLMVPLRDPNQPYEKPPADTAPEVTPEQASIAATPAVRDGRTADAGTGGTVGQGGEFGPLVSRGVASGAAGARRPAEPVRGLEGSGDGSELRPRYMAPAMIGAPAGLMASHLMYAPPAGYPVLAEVGHIQGRVLVEAVVGKNGRVIRAQAISGHHLLRGAAVREVYERRYRPYLLNDRPMDVATIVTVDFRLGR